MNKTRENLEDYPLEADQEKIDFYLERYARYFSRRSSTLYESIKDIATAIAYQHKRADYWEYQYRKLLGDIKNEN